MSLPAAIKTQMPRLIFCLEIGTEELPAQTWKARFSSLKQLVPAMLADLRLEHGDSKGFWNTAPAGGVDAIAGSLPSRT